MDVRSIPQVRQWPRVVSCGGVIDRMFEQTNPNNIPSGGQAIALALLHQVIATPGTFLMAMLVAYGFVGAPGRVCPGMLLTSLGIAFFCFCVALSVGYGTGCLFPKRAPLGYWSWVLPTIWLVAGFGLEVGFHNVSFEGEAQKLFYPEDTSMAWTFGTIPWLQSFLYSSGLVLSRRSN